MVRNGLAIAKPNNERYSWYNPVGELAHNVFGGEAKEDIRTERLVTEQAGRLTRNILSGIDNAKYSFNNKEMIDFATGKTVDNLRGGVVQQAWDRGTSNLNSAIATTGKMLSEDVIGSKDLAASFAEDAAYYNKAAAARPRKIETYQDISSLSDLGTYIKETVVETAPGTLTTLAGALPGTILRSGVGAAAGMYAGTAPQTLGETNNEFVAEGADTPDSRLTQYAVGGVLNPALDMLGLLKNIDTKSIRDVLAVAKADRPKVINAITTDVAKKAAIEGAVEALQTGTNKLAVSQYAKDYNLLSEENQVDIIDSFLRGAAGSTAASVPTSGYGAMAQSISNEADSIKAKRNALNQQEPTQAPAQEPTQAPVQDTVTSRIVADSVTESPTAPTATQFADGGENDVRNYAPQEQPTNSIGSNIVNKEAPKPQAELPKAEPQQEEEEKLPTSKANAVVTRFVDIDQNGDMSDTGKIQLAAKLANKLIGHAKQEGRPLTTLEADFAKTVGAAITAKTEIKAASILSDFAFKFKTADDNITRRESTVVGVAEKAPMQAADRTEMTDAELADLENAPTHEAVKERGVDYSGVTFLGTHTSKNEQDDRAVSKTLDGFDDDALSVRVTLRKQLADVQANYPDVSVSIVRAKQGGVKDKVWVYKLTPDTEAAKSKLDANWNGAIIRAKQAAKKYQTPNTVSGIRLTKDGKDVTLSMQTLIGNALAKAEVNDTKQDMQKYQEALHTVVTELTDRGYQFPNQRTNSPYDMILSALKAEADKRPNIENPTAAANNAVIYNSRGAKLTLHDINPITISNGPNKLVADRSNSYKAKLNPSPDAAKNRIAKLQDKMQQYDAVIKDSQYNAEQKEAARVARQKAIRSIEFNKQYLAENDSSVKERAEQHAGTTALDADISVDRVIKQGIKPGPSYSAIEIDAQNAANDAGDSKVNEDQASKKGDAFQSDRKDKRKEYIAKSGWYQNASRSLANIKNAFEDTTATDNDNKAISNAQKTYNGNLQQAADMFGDNKAVAADNVIEAMDNPKLVPRSAKRKNLHVLGSLAADSKIVSYTGKLINALGLNKKAIVYDEHTVTHAIKELGVPEDSTLAKQMFSDVTPGKKEDARTFFADKDNFARIYYYKGKYAVVIHSSMPKNKAMFALAHELGHAYLESTRADLIENKAIHTRLQKQWKHHLAKSAMLPKDYKFNEWFADQVALAIMGVAINKKGIIGRRFRELAANLKQALNFTISAALKDDISPHGELTQAGQRTLDKFTSDSYFAKLMDNILSGEQHLAHNKEFGEHLLFDSMDGKTKDNILKGIQDLPATISKLTFMERLSGYVAKVRRFFADQQYRAEAIDNAILAIDRMTSSGHTPLAKLWADGDARMRNIGVPGSAANKAAQEIADILFTPVERKAKPGFSNSVFAEMGMWLHHYSNAFDTKKLSREEMREVTQFLLSERDVREAPTKYRTTINAFRAVHNDFYTQVVSHIKTANAKTPANRKHHFPRLWDHTKVSAKRQELIDIINHHAQINNVKDVDAAASVDYIIALGNNPSLESIDAQPTKSNANDRTLWFVPNKAVMDLVIDEPDAVLNNYVQQMLKRYEWQSRVSSTDKNGKFLPRGKLDALIAQLPSDKDKEYAEQYVKAHLGQLRADMDPSIKGSMALMMALFNVAKLPLSTLSSLAETALIGVRLKDTNMKGVLGTLRDTKIKKALNRARAWGFTEERMLQQVVNSVYGSPASGTFTGKTADKINEALFKYNGQQFLTSFNRAIASTLGEEFLVTHALDAKNGNAKSRTYIAELIGEGKKADYAIDAIIRWHNAGRPTPKSNDIFRTKSKKDRVSDSVLVQHMLSRFVDEAVLRPNAGHRPLWASDPMWALVSHLKQYFWAAHKTIMPQLLTALKTTSLANPSAAMPLFYFGILAMGLSAFGLEARDELKQLVADKPDMTENMTPVQYSAEVFFRANGLFALEPIRSAAGVASWSDVAPYGFAEGFVPTLAYTSDLVSGDIGSVMPIYGVF